MGKILTLSTQKGGSSKSTTTAAVAHILSKEKGYKVLAVDFDPQGNLTELLTGYDPDDFSEETILEAIEDQNARNFIHQVEDNPNLFIIPADENLGIFSRYIFSKYYQKDTNGHVLVDEDGFIVMSNEANLVLRRTLEPIREEFDFILIDTPPFISDHIVNPLMASDGVIVVFQTNKLGFKAIRRFLDSIKTCQDGLNPNLRLYGILATMYDQRVTDSKVYLKHAEKKYKELLFSNQIKSQATVGRLSVFGFVENKELSDALEQYHLFVDELLNRLETDIHFNITREMLEIE